MCDHLSCRPSILVSFFYETKNTGLKVLMHLLLSILTLAAEN